MKSILLLSVLLLSLTCHVNGQIQPYGRVDTADLKMTSCSFEKDANAMVLFNKCTLSFTLDGELSLEHHIRLKIFNSNAYQLGDVSLEYLNDDEIEYLSDLKAETINLNGQKVEIEKVAKKSIYKQKENELTTHLTFSFPAVRAGCILEYSYIEQLHHIYVLPTWHFQGKLPVRYSECNLVFPKKYTFKTMVRGNRDLAINTDSVIAMENIPSLPGEPYMDSYNDNLASASIVFTSFDGSGNSFNSSSSWPDLGGELMMSEGYGKQLNVKLIGEDEIINHAKKLGSAEKIEFIFNKVKEKMTCYSQDNLYITGTLNMAWDKNSGNATEINLMLCRLLTQAGLPTSPVAVSSSKEDRIDQKNASTKNLSKTVAYTTIDGRKYYILDASKKENLWNKIPVDFFNTYGLYMNMQNSTAGLIFIEDNQPEKEIVHIEGEIIPEGKIIGTTQAYSFGYNKDFKLSLYNTLGEEKYTELLTESNNDLKITDLKLENTAKDSLPLTQTIHFNLALTASDDKYIYFNPRSFTAINNNPFLSKNRYSDIDFTFCRYYSIGARYKEPAGYTLESLPANINLLMPDRSITFKRTAEAHDGFIAINYVLWFKRSFFPKEQYPELYNFYKQMYEMLNEQIVLKKI